MRATVTHGGCPVVDLVRVPSHPNSMQPRRRFWVSCRTTLKIISIIWVESARRAAYARPATEDHAILLGLPSSDDRGIRIHKALHNHQLDDD